MSAGNMQRDLQQQRDRRDQGMRVNAVALGAGLPVTGSVGGV